MMNTTLLRQIFLFFALSILIVLFSNYIHVFIITVDYCYYYANLTLAPIFSGSMSGILFRKVLVLVLIPVLLAGIPALVYRLIKGKPLPYFLEITWLLWLILVLSKVLIQ